MGILRPIVQPFVGAVLNTGHDITLGCIIGSKLVGDHDARGKPLPFQKLSHQTFCSLGIATALNQDIQNKAVLIDGAPKPMLRASNDDHHLVEVPFVAEPAGRTATDSVGKASPNFSTHMRIVWCETMMFRAASMSSTMRRLSGNRK